MKIDVVSSFHLKQKGFAAKSVKSSNSYRLTPNPFCPPLPHSQTNSSNYSVFIRIKLSTFVIQKRGLFVFYATELNTCVHTYTYTYTLTHACMHAYAATTESQPKEGHTHNRNETPQNRYQKNICIDNNPSWYRIQRLFVFCFSLISIVMLRVT